MTWNGSFWPRFEQPARQVLCPSLSSLCAIQGALTHALSQRPADAACAAQIYGDVPMALGLTFQDRAVARQNQDISTATRLCEQLLPKCVLYPLVLGDTAEGGACSAALMEMMARMRTLGVRHLVYGQQESTWQYSCDFAM